MEKFNWEYKTDLEKAGLRVAKLLKANGFQAFWVGGVIRDKIVKRKTENIDIATDALPDQVNLILSREKIYTKPVGKKFGSILAIVANQKVEITTFRQEGFYSDNRHPDKIEFIKDYLEDAKRRDFTINALYFDPVSGELFDPANGQKDINGKLLRFVGDPKKRIDEDGLRMMRGVRLATELGFKLEKNSFAAIKTRAKYIQYISGERVKAELDKILLSDNRVLGLELLDQTSLLKFIIPESQKLKEVFHKSKNHHLEGDVLTHTFKALEILEKSPTLELVYAVLFHDIGKVIQPTVVTKDGETRFSFIGHIKLSEEIFIEFARKFKFSKRERDLIAWLISHHDDRENFMRFKIEEQLKYLMIPNIGLVLELWRVDSVANLRLINEKPERRESQAYVLAKELLPKVSQAQKLFHLADGKLIMKYTKLKPSPALGQKIDQVKAQIVLGKIKSEKDLKEYLAA